MTNKAIVLLILAAATVARLGAWGEDVRFHGDEALFATYGRNAAVYGDWMLSGPLDKPPISLYAMALSMQLAGVTTLPDGVLTLEARRGEQAARLPGTLAGIVTVGLLMAAAHKAGSNKAAWLAGALAACSPQLTAFSATAFTDPVMLALLTASVTAALYGRGGWSGVWLAAAAATKQQALFYLPLAAALNAVEAPDGLRDGEGLRWSRVRNFALTSAAGLGVLLLWDAARPGASIFEYAAANNNPYRMIVPPDEWGARSAQWAVYFASAFGAWPVTAGIVACALASVFTSRARLQVRSGRAAKLIPTAEGSLLLFTLAYLGAHVVLPFNVYDRYLLLIYPPVILLAARTLARIAPRNWTLPAVAALLLLSLSAPARFPSDVRDRDDGLIALADFVNAQGLGTIVYNRWLGWEMGYYLGPWTDKRVVFYPTADEFAADAPLNPDRAARLLIAPAWAPVTDWLNASTEAGFAPWTAYRSADYVAFWLEGID